MTDGIERFEGTCPECDGEATVYPTEEGSDKGHVHCEEEDCGWVHRRLQGVGRYIVGKEQARDEAQQVREGIR